MFNLILMEAGIHSTKWSYLINYFEEDAFYDSLLQMM